MFDTEQLSSAFPGFFLLNSKNKAAVKQQLDMKYRAVIETNGEAMLAFLSVSILKGS